MSRHLRLFHNSHGRTLQFVQALEIEKSHPLRIIIPMAILCLQFVQALEIEKKKMSRHLSLK